MSDSKTARATVIVHAITDYASAKVVAAVYKRLGAETVDGTPNEIVLKLEKIAVENYTGGAAYRDTYSAMGGPIINGVMFRRPSRAFKP